MWRGADVHLTRYRLRSAKGTGTLHPGVRGLQSTHHLHQQAANPATRPLLTMGTAFSRLVPPPVRGSATKRVARTQPAINFCTALRRLEGRNRSGATGRTGVCTQAACQAASDILHTARRTGKQQMRRAPVASGNARAGSPRPARLGHRTTTPIAGTEPHGSRARQRARHTPHWRRRILSKRCTAHVVHPLACATLV